MLGTADHTVTQAAIRALWKPAAEPGVHGKLAWVLPYGPKLLPARRAQHAPAHARRPKPAGPSHPGPRTPGTLPSYSWSVSLLFIVLPGSFGGPGVCCVSISGGPVSGFP